ncbi:hypothetical protein CC86DRAFT_198219 [Ophiobolus disseminans]|uniref:Grap2 and cyclin-D-interacting-domain-containing protein n=1 Tax=Ophiobolus disseminans TaxID=1469910 RepID=A0A6A7A7W6_9PLEO|nr:hypothetical protein CC86DRAFT_198219 [Ophiobolus disseminans]
MAKPKDIKALIEVTRTTQTLLSHFQSSLAPSSGTTPSEGQTTAAELPNPLDVVKATTTLLKSHTTTLSLLLINPPLTPSALIAKIGDVSSGALSGMVAAASYVPQPGSKDNVGNIMRTELRAQVRRLLGTWGDVLALVLRIAESRQGATGKDTGPTESEKQDVLSATGVLWDACDALLKLCDNGVVGLVVKKAGELRATLLDAIEELKEWGEDMGDEDEDAAEGSDDEDDMFGASNKLGKDDKELKELLDTSVKRLKMAGMLYQALIKRRLKTYPAASASTSTAAASTPAQMLDDLMAQLKSIPDTVDDLASAFYDLDHDEAKQTLDKACAEAKCAAGLVRQSWTGTDDEFTAWSAKWLSALDAA